jgi:hypothetical protein
VTGNELQDIIDQAQYINPKVTKGYSSDISLQAKYEKAQLAKEILRLNELVGELRTKASQFRQEILEKLQGVIQEL